MDLEFDNIFFKQKYFTLTQTLRTVSATGEQVDMVGDGPGCLNLGGGEEGELIHPGGGVHYVCYLRMLKSAGKVKSL